MHDPQSTSSSRVTQRAWVGCGTQVGTTARVCAFSKGGGKTFSLVQSPTPVSFLIRHTIIMLCRHQAENRTPTVLGSLLLASLTSCTLIRSRKATVGTFLSSNTSHDFFAVPARDSLILTAMWKNARHRTRCVVSVNLHIFPHPFASYHVSYCPFLL